ncbi:MAG TPA: class I SAM-dependent methyltransferase [Solirubrobacteraceae bacterium]|nr:class I SAM-dependent methyltransferase [Solirubrobacteraceae bacterium]
MDAVSAPPRWNHNTHYHPLILGAVPPGCRRSLDVGCGEGMLARELRQVVPHVTGIDRDAASIGLARRQDEDIEFILGDFMTHPFQPASFDHIASIAVLHHMDAAAALKRMRELLAPGGTLAIVGLARKRYPADLPFAIAGAVGHRVHRLSKPCWEDSAPRLWPPPDTYAQTQRLARRVLPGVRYRRLLLFRYSLVWTKPA